MAACAEFQVDFLKRKLDSNSRPDLQVVPTHVVIISLIPAHVVIVRLDSNLFLCLHIYVIVGIQLTQCQDVVGIQLTQCQDVVGIQHTPKQRNLESKSGYGGVRWIPSRLFRGQVGFQLTF